MYKIDIYTVGKHKESWLAKEIALLEKRLSNLCSFTWHFFKKEEDFEDAVLALPSFTLLDERGKMVSSVAFSQYLEGNIRLSFVIGGANGVGEKIRKKASLSLSFSLMTFTHQHIRLLLIEQIYRGFTIFKGTPYHK